MTKKRDKPAPSKRKPKLNKETLKDLDVTEKPEGDEVRGGQTDGCGSRNPKWTYSCNCSI